MKFSKPKFGLLIFSLVGFISLFIFLVPSIDAISKIPEIPLSILAEKIQQEQVENITLRGNNLEVELKDGTRLYSKKEPDVSLSESLLNLGVSAEKLKKVEIVVKQEGPLTVWFLPVFLFILPFFILLAWFIALYFLILLGFKILKIEAVPKSKIIIYIFAMVFLGLFLNYAIPAILKDVSNKFVFYFTNFLISFGIVFLLLKYYFLLSGKKLWQFLLYLIILNLILSIIVILFQRLLFLSPLKG